MDIGSADAKNAPVFAVQILALSDAKPAAALDALRAEQKAEVIKRDSTLENG
jgi:phosphoribosylcarboxyaminoimidazole (NCAIR) mutase